MEKIEFDDVEESLFSTDMITPFSSKNLEVDGDASGYDTILWTYLVKDGYKFDVNIEQVEIETLLIPYINNQRMYILTELWQSEHTKELINLIGNNKLTVQTIVVYGHSLTLESQNELRVALNQVDVSINLIVRY